MRISFNLNGTRVQIEATPNERLLYVLRREFGLKSLKASCQNGQCGSCTILLNDKPVPSCLIPVFKVEDSEIITLEHFKTMEEYKIIMDGFEQAGVNMCGFCNSGKIFFAYSMLHSILDLSEKELEEQVRRVYSSSMCRCTSFDDLYLGMIKIRKIQKRK